MNGCSKAVVKECMKEKEGICIKMLNTARDSYLEVIVLLFNILKISDVICESTFIQYT